MGRFKQFRKYRSFNDSATEDHGSLGIAVMEEEGIFGEIDRKFPELGEAVRYSVAHHNKLSIPAGGDQLSVQVIKIVKDHVGVHLVLNEL